MYKSDADDIAQGMAKLLEKRAGVWDWMKKQFGFENFKRLDYAQFIQTIKAATTCQELPDLRQWDRTGSPSMDVELGMNMLKRNLEEKRKQLNCQ